MTTLDFKDLDVARLVVLLERQAEQRERDARFYRDLKRAECVEECERATSDATLLAAVLGRMASADLFRVVEGEPDEQTLNAPDEAQTSADDATGTPLGPDAWWHG